MKESGQAALTDARQHQSTHGRFPRRNSLKKLGARNAADLVHKVAENDPAAAHDRQTRFLTGVNACRPERAKHDCTSTDQPTAGACHGQHQF
ncbi:hypothetical protein [Bradyrhizobium sp. AZCC 2230]|uniref:hypothetical protein n=1 Tax=Bradyrhizobium sp. AZCC 2230 TaxID=3117021 RepID=UPI003FA5D1D2